MKNIKLKQIIIAAFITGAALSAAPVGVLAASAQGGSARETASGSQGGSARETASGSQGGSAGETLTIEVPVIDAVPGDIIDVPVIITSNPGVSVIKDLRIDVRRGLELYFPQGMNSYTNNGAPATWPYIPGQPELGTREGVLPVMGRPTAANISENHIVFNFLDVALPFDSIETGTLVTLRVKVTEEATGVIPITLNGGMYGDMTLSGDNEPVLVHGGVDAGSGDDAAGSGSDDGVIEQNQPEAERPDGAIDDDIIEAALRDEAPYIKLTPQMGTVITDQMYSQIKEAGKRVTFELPDGTIIEIDPDKIPAAGTGSDGLREADRDTPGAASGQQGSAGIDLMDMLPAAEPDTQAGGNGVLTDVIFFITGVAVCAAVIIAVYNIRKRKNH